MPITEFLSECPTCRSVKRRISQRLRHTDVSWLRRMARPPKGVWYRKQWLKNHEIPLGTATENYVKNRLLKELGPEAFLK